MYNLVLATPLPLETIFSTGTPEPLNGYPRKNIKIQFFLIIVSLKSSAGPVDFKFRNPAKVFSRRLENWSLKNRENLRKISKWNFSFLKHFFQTRQCSFDEPAQKLLSKVRTFFSQSQKLFEKLSSFQTFVVHQNVRLDTWNAIFAALCTKFSPRSSKTTQWKCDSNYEKPFFKKRIQKLRSTVKWSFGNPVQTFWQKFKKPKNEIFSETIFFSNYSSGLVCAFLTNPSTFYAKNWNSFARSPRKNKKLLVLQKQVRHL